MNDNLEISMPVAKLVTIWGLFGFSSMAEAASFATFTAGFLASFVSLLILIDWFWKRLWKPLFIHMEWFGYKRRIMTVAEDAIAKSEEEQG